MRDTGAIGGDGGEQDVFAAPLLRRSLGERFNVVDHFTPRDERSRHVECAEEIERRENRLDLHGLADGSVIHSLRAEMRALEESIAAIEHKQRVQGRIGVERPKSSGQRGYELDRDQRAGTNGRARGGAKIKFH